MNIPSCPCCGIRIRIAIEPKAGSDVSLRIQDASVEFTRCGEEIPVPAVCVIHDPGDIEQGVEVSVLVQLDILAFRMNDRSDIFIQSGAVVHFYIDALFKGKLPGALIIVHIEPS